MSDLQRYPLNLNTMTNVEINAVSIKFGKNIIGLFSPLSRRKQDYRNSHCFSFLKPYLVLT